MKTLMNMMIALLLLIANITIAQAINYPTYNNSTQVVYVTPNTLTPGYKAGDEVFQTCDLTPLVKDNGMAVEPYSAAPGRPRRALGDRNCATQGHYDGDYDGVCDECEERVHIGTGAVTIDPTKPIGVPIGSILVLLLFALMHVAFIAYTKKDPLDPPA